MIISRKHKYCFIEYPRSASYAIRTELLKFYGGEDWLQKHSSYKAFVNSLPGEHQDYFVFCSLRTPLEDVVSIYNIYRTNASGRAKPEFWRDYKWYIRRRELRRAKFFAGAGDKSFQQFFARFFAMPYVKPRIVAELYRARFNHIIRVENLQEDFAVVLRKLGLRQIRPVQVVNRSSGGGIDLDAYYPIELRRRAVRVLGPMMRFMDYDFPQHWNVPAVPWSSRLYFAAVKPLAAWFANNVAYGKDTPKKTGDVGLRGTTSGHPDRAAGVSRT